MSTAIVNDTLSILTKYAFPRLAQYYSSKGKPCTLEQYQNQIIQYFITYNLSIHNFYNSSISKSVFISNIIKYIDDANGTKNDGNFPLQTAIKRLYTILQLHQHTKSSGSQLISQRPINKNVAIVQQSEVNIKRKERERMDVVHELSTAQSELVSLQQTVDVFKQIADKTQKKLLETEEKKLEYKQAVNELTHELQSEKTQTNDINLVNKQLQNELAQILAVNRQLNEKMVAFENNQQTQLHTVQQYKQTMSSLDNMNKQLKHDINNKNEENQQKQCEYTQIINNLKQELKSKQAKINEIHKTDCAEIELWRKQLQINSKLDFLDLQYVWCTSIVTDSDRYRIKIRYCNNNNDPYTYEWIDRGSTRLAPYMTKTYASGLKVVAKQKDKRTGQTRKIYKQGFLVKQGKMFKSYKTRYFRLMDDGTMNYFKKITDTSPLGSFNINNMIETRIIEYPNNKTLHGFEIVTTQRTWRLQAQSHDSVTDWLHVIHALSKSSLKTVDNTNNNNSNNNNTNNNNKHVNINGSILSIDEESIARSHPPINRADMSGMSDMKQQIKHKGWMYKAGKWDANWTYRYCVLQNVHLKCYVSPNKKQTHCIDFKDVKSCIEIQRNSEKFIELEIPTAFAFHLITLSRVYTFACKSRDDLNIWLKTIDKIVNVTSNDSSKDSNREYIHMRDGSGRGLIRRSSIVEVGSTLNKLGTSFGRLIGVTPEHVTTTQVLQTCEKIQISPPDRAQRRTSLPTIHLNESIIDKSRRKSTPNVPQIDNQLIILNQLNDSNIDTQQTEAINMDENNIDDDDDDFLDESEISSLDQYD